MISDPCPDCRGQGRVPKKSTIDVVIPPGVDNGDTVRVRGEGEPSPNGGPPGSCLCVIRVRPHKLFEREGTHLILRLPITYSQAALGATIEVPTLNGREELNVPRGTASGEVFRLRGKGLADPRGRSGKGDLHVQTVIEVPKKLSKKQEELLRDLAEVEHKEVSPERKSFFAKLADYFMPDEDDEEEKSEKE